MVRLFEEWYKKFGVDACVRFADIPGLIEFQ